MFSLVFIKLLVILEYPLQFKTTVQIIGHALSPRVPWTLKEEPLTPKSQLRLLHLLCIKYTWLFRHFNSNMFQIRPF